MADIFNDDFRDFIQAFNECNVEYILIGGYSVIIYGYQRVTGDMDIWVNKTIENYKNIIKAFEKFGMPIFDMTEKKFLSNNKTSEVFRFGISPTRIDLMTKVKGMEFDVCIKEANWFQDEELKVRVIHYNQLLESKKASNRVKDKEDIKNLSRLKKLLK